jgi:carboxymethylenebutenolidase
VNVQSKMVTVETADGAMPAHLAIPDGEGPFPGVVVVMEAFGLNAHIKDVADRIAREGYIVAAPDMYYRASGERVCGYDELPKAIQLMMDLPGYDAIVGDVRATIALLESQPGIDAGQIGMTGFCMGGFVTFLAACHLPIKAAAPFYGGGIGRNMMPSERRPHPPIDDAAGITGALLVFYGDKDGFIPPEEVALVKERLAALGKDAQVIVYPGAEHGFFCDERPSYHEAAAQDAWRKLLRFFETKLRR